MASGALKGAQKPLIVTMVASPFMKTRMYNAYKRENVTLMAGNKSDLYWQVICKNYLLAN